ncbi:MAG TPA: transglycosylase SLT domain-containing protein [bacterium]|nr:transglycosylase SLT domain-containing protein [bacterium]HPN43215.1 transglycosylase SLT domain-containing protein [bacterium]
MSSITFNTDFIPVDPAKSGAKDEQELKRLRKSCTDFESLFVSKLLTSMRSTVGESTLFGDGMGSEVYQSMFDSKMAEKIAENGGLGIAAILYKQLTGKDMEKTLETEPISVKKLIRNIPFKPDSSTFERISNFHPVIKSAAEKFQVPMHLVYGVIAQESSGNPNVISKAGAKGLMQLMDGTAAELGVRNSFDPEENIYGGVKYLREQLDQFNGDTELALAAYNAGPANVEKFGGIPPFSETQNYIKKVLEYADIYNKKLENI